MYTFEREIIVFTIFLENGLTWSLMSGIHWDPRTRRNWKDEKKETKARNKQIKHTKKSFMYVMRKT